MKKYFITGGIILVLLLSVFIYFRFFFTYTQRTKIQRSIETVTGQNLRVTVFDVNGKIVKRWSGVEKINSSPDNRGYLYFYTEDGKYVQIPATLWYIAEEE
ncbi:MAG: hypothetical protein ACRCUT_00130 [Spirochaetota bacterium]